MPNTYSDWNVELENIKRNRSYADALRQQALDPIKSETAGGYVVPIHPFQGLAKMLQAYGARRGDELATEQSRDLVTRRNKALADTLRGAFEPKTEQTPFVDTAGEAMGVGTPQGLVASERQVPKTPQEISQALMANPDTMNIGGQMMLKGYEQKMKMDPAYIDAQRKIKAAGATPYYTPVQTGQGVMSFDARTGRINPVTVGGAPVIGSTSDPNLQAGIAYGKEAAKGAGESDIQQHETAIAAAENLNKINELTQHLKSSDAITGLGADLLKNIERVKVFVADSERSGRKVSDTELLDAMMGSEVFPMIKQLGIGARGLDTPAEREFLRQVMTGTISMNKATLLRISEIRKNVSERAIQRWNSRLDKGELDKYFQMTGRTKEKIGGTSPVTGKTPVRTGTLNGRKVIQYSDGTTAYAD